MEKRLWWCLAVSAWLCAAVPAPTSADEVWEDISRGNLETSAVLALPGAIYMGAKGGVFVSNDGASNWRNILSLRGDKGRVNLLYSDPAEKDSLYAATASGLFYSGNKGDTWKRIFKGRTDQQDYCSALLVCSEAIFLGTGQGLYASRDHGRTWQKESGRLANSPILAFAYIQGEAGEKQVYAAAVEGVFRMGCKDGIWERVFVPRVEEQVSGVCDGEDDLETIEERTSNIRYLAVSAGSNACLYLATSRGVYVSMDKAITWKAMTDYGLLSRNVKFILLTPANEIYAATRSGIFKYTGQRWQELSLALAVEDTRFLAVDSNSDLYAACDRGLFRAQRRNFAAYNVDEKPVSSVQEEPNIDELQKAAIKYAEVCPEKIKLWRKQAMTSAFLPTLSAMVNRDTGDLWHWESGSSTKSGDDVLIKGSDSLGWDVRLSWDLSQIVWNPDQTSIDVRSRLMVELRNDILDEVNKLYFERLRVKMELEELHIEDKRKRMEKELRFKELTASLDGLTGGYFSRKKGCS